MKIIVASLCLACMTLLSHAQIKSNPSFAAAASATVSPVVMKPAEPFAYEITYPPGYRMRNAGRFLTIAGGAMLAGGIAVYASADEKYYNAGTVNGNSYEEGDPKAALGIVMIVAGTGMTIPGIILWTKGAKKYNRYLERQSQTTTLNLKGNGVSLAYRF